MLRFVPFEPGHLAVIEVQLAQRDALRLLRSPALAAQFRTHGVALTGIADEPDGTARVAGCAGILHQWPGRALAWALMGRTRPQEWTQIARQMASMIRVAHRAGIWRIEAQCDAAFAAGQRLLALLGFEREGLMRRYSPEGRDSWLYARVLADGAGGAPAR